MLEIIEQRRRLGASKAEMLEIIEQALSAPIRKNGGPARTINLAINLP